MKNFILASASPRRRDLLRVLGIEPVIRGSSVPEAMDPAESHADNVMRIAREKAADVAAVSPDACLLAADTVVVLDGVMLGKPMDAPEAAGMLRRLSGRTHEVYTGVCLAMTDAVGRIIDERLFFERTLVTFRELRNEEIDRYVESGSPMDKAGAYGIQDDQGMLFVSRIEGDYFNVVGLPVSRTWSELASFAPNLISDAGPAAHLSETPKESIRASGRFDDLVRLVKVLRRECPWDREQTHESVKGHLIEEAYEVVDAIERRDMEGLRGELGDLLLHVLFQARLAAEPGHFEIEDVIRELSTKLIRRHPHVFGDVKVDGSAAVAGNWESIKMKEGRSSVLEGLPGQLPALLLARRMQEKVSNVGFDWSDWRLAWEKLDEELGEWRAELEAGSRREAILEEFGDVLFSMVNVGRLLGLDAEDALRAVNAKFKRRFQYIEKELEAMGKSPKDSDLEEMDALWNKAKGAAG